MPTPTPDALQHRTMMPAPAAAAPPAAASAASADEARFEPMNAAWLDAVVAIEQATHSHPWTRGNFADSIAAGYACELLLAGDTLLGYFVAMKAADEVHLLNITVAPAWQRQGCAWLMLDALALWSRAQGARWLWLEVRASNARAIAVYERHGFGRMGQRPGYYPGAPGAPREDAILMSLTL